MNALQSLGAMLYEQDELREERARLQQELALMRQWILSAGHDEAFQAWRERVQVERLHG